MSMRHLVIYQINSHEVIATVSTQYPDTMTVSFNQEKQQLIWWQKKKKNYELL